MLSLIIDDSIELMQFCYLSTAQSQFKGKVQTNETRTLLTSAVAKSTADIHVPTVTRAPVAPRQVFTDSVATDTRSFDTLIDICQKFRGRLRMTGQSHWL